MWNPKDAWTQHQVSDVEATVQRMLQCDDRLAELARTALNQNLDAQLSEQ